MNVAESKRTRHLVIHVERGEELPTALIRALDEVEAKAGTITGSGIFEAVEINGLDVRGQTHTRRVNMPAVVTSLSGSIAIEYGTTNVYLHATLAQEGPFGHTMFGGRINWARARALELFVTVFDDLGLTREMDEQGFSSALHATPRNAGGSARMVVQEPPPSSVVTTPAPAAASPAPAPKAVTREPESEPKAQPQPPQAPAAAAPALTPPARPHKAQEDTTEVYPDVADLVAHFHFGECEVISSDGERIRLRQIKDGRVREVSLTMLKIEGPTTDAVTSKRHFKLSRKN